MYPHMNVPYLPLPLSDYVSVRRRGVSSLAISTFTGMHADW
jgi:hypothetical protein